MLKFFKDKKIVLFNRDVFNEVYFRLLYYIIGFYKLLKAKLRIDRASEELVRKRLFICNGCKNRKISLLGYKCSVCKCIIKDKVKLKSESCPIDKW